MTYFLSFHESLLFSCLDINSMRSINSQPKPVKRELAGTTLVVCLSVVPIRVCMWVSVCMCVYACVIFFPGGRGWSWRWHPKRGLLWSKMPQDRGKGWSKILNFKGISFMHDPYRCSKKHCVKTFCIRVFLVCIILHLDWMRKFTKTRKAPNKDTFMRWIDYLVLQRRGKQLYFNIANQTFGKLFISEDVPIQVLT